jgi:hypothetical protein
MENKMLKSVRVILATSAVLLLLGWAAPANSSQDQQEREKGQEKRQEHEKPAKQDQPQANKQQGQSQQQHQQAKGQQDQQRQPGQGDKPAKQDQQQAQDQQQGRRQDNSARQQQQQQARREQNQQEQQRERDNSAGQQQQARRQDDQQHQQSQKQNYGSAQERSPAQTRQQQVAWQRDRAHSWKSEHRDWQQRGGYNGYRVPEARFRGYYGQDHGFRIYSLPVRYVGGQRRFQHGGYWFGLVDPWPEYWSPDWYDSDDMYVDYSGDGYYLYNRSHPGDRIAISFYVN